MHVNFNTIAISWAKDYEKLTGNVSWKKTKQGNLFTQEYIKWIFERVNDLIYENLELTTWAINIGNILGYDNGENETIENIKFKSQFAQNLYDKTIKK